MSRSRTKGDYLRSATKAGSQKSFSKIEHKRRRAKERQALNPNSYDEDSLPLDKEFGNEWYSPRDGFGGYSGNIDEYEWLRKYKRK